MKKRLRRESRLDTGKEMKKSMGKETTEQRQKKMTR